MKSKTLGRHTSYDTGVLAQMNGDDRRAMACYRREIQESGFANAHFNLAWLLQKRRRFGEAIDHYRAAARSAHESASTRAEIWNNLGNAYAGLGRRADAAYAFRHAARLNPKQPKILLNLALMYFESGSARLGRNWLARAATAASRVLATEPLAAHLFIAYDVDVARGVRILKRLQRSGQLAADGEADLAVGYAKLGDTLRSMQHARQAVRRAARAQPRTKRPVRASVRIAEQATR